MNAVAWTRLLLIAALAIGHVSFWIWLYNRINALGLERKTIKRLELTIVLICLSLPLLLFCWEWRFGTWGATPQHVWGQFQESRFYLHATHATLTYSVGILAFLVWNTPRWFFHRPAFAIARNRYQTLQHHFDPHLHRRNPHWVLGSRSRYCLAIPGNEILSLEFNVKRVFLSDIDDAFVGMRIGHLSDIHLMGQISPDFTRYCVDWIVSKGAEILIVSGDLVDHARAVPDLERALGGAPPDIPKFFVLGNHDRAHGLVDSARDAMVGLGWLDAGERDWWISTPRGLCHVLGNERPWLERHTARENSSIIPGEQRRCLVLGVSHSPDQFRWARSQGCHLLLCGHTHGGQIRIPGIGPIIAPSWHGGRYASGVFYQSPTLMHVSRGISGTHPLRFRCPPEATLLQIASATPLATRRSMV